MGSNFGEIYRVLAESFVHEHFTPFLATSTLYFIKIRGLNYELHIRGLQRKILVMKQRRELLVMPNFFACKISKVAPSGFPFNVQILMKFFGFLVMKLRRGFNK